MEIKDLFTERKQKPLINLDILRKRYHIQPKHLIVPLIFIIFFLINRKYFLFGILTVLSGIFSYYHDRFNRSPIDFKLPLVIGIIITRFYGLGFTAIFFFMSDMIPSLLGGGRIEGTTLLFIGWYFSVNSIVLLFPGMDIITLGMILVLVEAVGSVVIQGFFGIPAFMAAATSVLTVATRLIYFATIGRLLVGIYTFI